MGKPERCDTIPLNSLSNASLQIILVSEYYKNSNHRDWLLIISYLYNKTLIGLGCHEAVFFYGLIKRISVVDLFYLNQAMLGCGPVTSSEAFIIGIVRQLVAPELSHVEALGVPDMSLKPHGCELTSVVFHQQVAWFPAIFTAWALSLCGQSRLLHLS